MEVKPAALCCKTCRGPSLTPLLKALQVRGLAGLSVMPAGKLGWERLLLLLRQVTHSSAAAFLESSPDLSARLTVQQKDEQSLSSSLWLLLGSFQLPTPGKVVLLPRCLLYTHAPALQRALFLLKHSAWECNIPHLPPFRQPAPFQRVEIMSTNAKAGLLLG